MSRTAEKSIAIKTNKTPSVMRLLRGSSSASNPMLDHEFKKENIIPKESKKIMLNGKTALEREVTINVTSELISEWMPKLLERFNCCGCDICAAEASVEAMERTPSILIKVKDKKDIVKAEKLKQDNQMKILMVLVQIAVERKKLPKHT